MEKTLPCGIRLTLTASESDTYLDMALTMLESIRLCAVMLFPFMPGASEKMKESLPSTANVVFFSR